MALALLAGVAVAIAIWRAERPAPASAPSGAATAAPPERCASRLDEAPPSFTAAPPLAPPRSRLVASAALPTKWLAAQIARQAPTTLASAKRKDVGAPGEVSYVVSRGDFSFALEGERLWVRTPVGAQAEICKPIGPLCPVYGSCAPRLGAGVGVPLMIDALDEGARVSLQVYEGCSIVGFDATSRIEAQAKQQLAGVKARIDRSIPSAEERAELFGRLAEPWPLGGDGCLRMRPERIVQAPPALGEALTLRFALEGTAELAGCEASPPNAAPPRIERGAVDDESEVALPVAWPWAAIERAIGDALDDEELRVESLQGMADGPAVVLRLRLDGPICGPLWLASPVTIEGEALTFAAPRALSTGAIAGEALARVQARLEAVRLPLPPAAATSRAELMRLEDLLVERLRELPEDLGLAARLEGAPAAFEAEVDAEGIRLVARRRFRLVADLRR